MLQPVHYIGAAVVNGVGGDSQPQKIRFSDGRIYVVKFGDNPARTFGLRVLPAELVASRVASLVGVRTPDFRVVHVGKEFIQKHENLAFRTEQERVQPKPGPCLASPWVEGATPVLPEQAPQSEQNVKCLASLFVADNLLCMNKDHCGPYNNVLLDSRGEAWVVDWGHPFFFYEGGRIRCYSNWCRSVLAEFVQYADLVSKEVLVLPRVKAQVMSVARAASQMSRSDLETTFQGIPPEWAVSSAEASAALDFLHARVKLLPDLLAGSLG